MPLLLLVLVIASADGGCSWDPVEGLLANLEVAALRAAHAAPGVWKSVDGGGSRAPTAR